LDIASVGSSIKCRVNNLVSDDLAARMNLTLVILIEHSASVIGR